MALVTAASNASPAAGCCVAPARSLRLLAGLQGLARSAASLAWGSHRFGSGLERYKPMSVQGSRLIIKIIVENSRKVQSRFFTFLGLFVLVFSPIWTVRVQPDKP